MIEIEHNFVQSSESRRKKKKKKKKKNDLYVYIRDNKNAFESREIHFVASAARKIRLRRNCASVSIPDNKKEKSGNVTRWNDGMEVQRIRLIRVGK